MPEFHEDSDYEGAFLGMVSEKHAFSDTASPGPGRTKRARVTVDGGTEDTGARRHKVMTDGDGVYVNRIDLRPVNVTSSSTTEYDHENLPAGLYYDDDDDLGEELPAAEAKAEEPPVRRSSRRKFRNSPAPEVNLCATTNITCEQ